MSNRVTLMVRSGAKGGRWRKYGEYPSRDEAWVAITGLDDKRAHVRLVESNDTPATDEQHPPTAHARSTGPTF